MCFDLDSEPPIPRISGAAVSHDDLVLEAAGVDKRPDDWDYMPLVQQLTHEQVQADVAACVRDLRGMAGSAVGKADDARPEDRVPLAPLAQGELFDEISVPVLTPRQAKGLEFDHVVVVEPAAVADDGDRGLRELYVALTRPTQTLVVVHARPLPEALGR